MNFRQQRKSKAFVLATIVLIIIGGLLYIVCGKLIYSNMTDSAPKGLYIAALNQEIRRGDYVIVRLPEGVEKLHVNAGFLLLKHVQAFPGESYQVDEERLCVNHQSYTIYHKDGLPQLKPGRYIVPDGELLLLNDMDESFDSRYLGTIKESQIDKKVLLLLPYEPILNIIGGMKG